MFTKVLKRIAPLVPAALLFTACEQQNALPTEAERADAVVQSAKPVSGASSAKIQAAVDRMNAKFAAAGSQVRVGLPWMFTQGVGTDPFGTLRTGNRWAKANLSYVLDTSDYTTDVPFAEVDGAMSSAYDSWSKVANTYIQVNRAADDGKNNDITDGIIRNAAGECVDFFDYTATPWVKDANGNLTGDVVPTADIVVAGWADAEYFKDCMGSEDIIAITWTFYGPDTNGDNYPDTWFVEQLYNKQFKWTTTDAVYLDFDAPMDIETIAAHENGHALGLGHFGGPINRQPFKLQPNGKVFNPEAVMNPYNIGGEKRIPLATDIAGLRTLYTGHVSTTTAH